MKELFRCGFRSRDWTDSKRGNTVHESDTKLVARCLKGDARSWERLLQMYNGRIFNMAYRYTGRYDVAEELAQDVFLKVYQNLSSYQARSGSLRNWIMRVGRNLIIDHYRATKKDKNVAGTVFQCAGYDLLG